METMSPSQVITIGNNNASDLKKSNFATTKS